MRCYVAANSAYIRRVIEEFPDHCGIMQTAWTGNNTLDIDRLQKPWVCDNGFFARPDFDRFKTLCCNVAGMRNLEWVAVPDVVGNARATIKSWNLWRPWMEYMRLPLAFVLQDGIRLSECPPAVAYFIGGSTKFKLSPETALLARQLRDRGAKIHMGRVNTLSRLVYAHSIGCDSVDGSSMARWSKTYLRWFCQWARYLDVCNTGKLPT